MQAVDRGIGRLDWLDYARLVCALWVMLDHYLVTLVHPWVMPGVRGFGFAADIAIFGPIALFVFLMMSGMVITIVAQRQSAETFVAHRFARVYPTFFILMTLTAILSHLGPERIHVTLPQYLANLPINAPLFGHRFVGGVYWTLVVEVLFYAGVLAVIMTGAVRRMQTVVTVWVLLQAITAPLPWRLPLISLDYYFIAAGAVLGLYYQGRNDRQNLALLAVAVPLCMICVVHYAGKYHYDPVIGAIATVLIFALFLFMRGRNPKLPGARRIGSMTYALYLLHFHVGMIIFYHWMNDANKWWLVAGTCLFVTALSFAFDDLIEFRLRRFWVDLSRRTIARPFARWDRRSGAAARASTEAAEAPQSA